MTGKRDLVIEILSQNGSSNINSLVFDIVIKDNMYISWIMLSQPKWSVRQIQQKRSKMKKLKKCSSLGFSRNSEHNVKCILYWLTLYIKVHLPKAIKKNMKSHYIKKIIPVSSCHLNSHVCFCVVPTGLLQPSIHQYPLLPTGQKGIRIRPLLFSSIGKKLSLIYKLHWLLVQAYIDSRWPHFPKHTCLLTPYHLWVILT